MRNKIIKGIFAVLLISLLLGLMSCDAVLDMIPGFNTGDGKDDVFENNDPENLILIKDNKALFQIVFTEDVGSSVMIRINDFIKQLRGLGIEINDPILDTKGEPSDCELIIGTGADKRGDEVNINSREIGKDGKIIKVVGNRVVIAGGDDSTTFGLLDSYIKRHMGIDSNASDVSNVFVRRDYSYYVPTEYRIKSITIDGIDLKEFTFIEDLSSMIGYAKTFVNRFRNDLYEASGYWMEDGKLSDIASYEHCFVIRYTSDAGEKGFRAFYDGKNYIIECSWANAFERTLEVFGSTMLYSNKDTSVTIKSTARYERDVTVALYSDFGAKGDGRSDDYAAIKATHEYANAGGQKVLGSPGATYYISPESFTKSIPVKTNVDFRGATIVVDDRGNTAFQYRTLALFVMAREQETRLVDLEAVKAENGGSLSIPAGATSLPWLVPYLETKSLVRIENANHKDYVRYGTNESNGNSRHEVLIVSEDGTIDPDTFVFFDYETLTKVSIDRADDPPILIENGMFYNICCRTVAATNFKVKYLSYNRGMRIQRSNVTFNNIKHRMLDEPELGPTPDIPNLPNSAKNRGDFTESYPYNRGFYCIDRTYNLFIQNGEICGHTTYTEAKPGTASSGGAETTNYVNAGSYDFVVEDSTHIKFYNVQQYNIDYHREDNGTITQVSRDTGVGDERYWGIMSSNFARNITFDKCSISRIDAHMGYFNVTVTDTVVGHTFNAVGGGTIYAKNVTRITGDSFIKTRGDYGGTFKGTIILEDCVFEGRSDYYTNRGSSMGELGSAGYSYLIDPGYNEDDTNMEYNNWKFGYDCYMPNVTVKGSFTHYCPKIFVYRKTYHRYYTFYYEPNKNNPGFYYYHLPEEIIFIDFVLDGDGINSEGYIPINKSDDPENDYMTKRVSVSVVHSEKD